MWDEHKFNNIPVCLKVVDNWLKLKVKNYKIKQKSWVKSFEVKCVIFRNLQSPAPVNPFVLKKPANVYHSTYSVDVFIGAVPPDTTKSSDPWSLLTKLTLRGQTRRVRYIRQKVTHFIFLTSILFINCAFQTTSLLFSRILSPSTICWSNVWSRISTCSWSRKFNT